jgi:hypothetical protein
LLNVDQGMMPELAMFGVEDGGPQWLFGIHGSLYPLTDSMQLKLIAGDDLQTYQQAVERLDGNGSRPLI